MALATLVAISGHKKVLLFRAQPSQWCEMDLPASKSLSPSAIKKVHWWFYVHEFFKLFWAQMAISVPKKGSRPPKYYITVRMELKGVGGCVWSQIQRHAKYMRLFLPKLVS